MLTHGVNIGQALKSEAVWWRRSHDDTDADSTRDRLAKLDKYHGVPSGMYQAGCKSAGRGRGGVCAVHALARAFACPHAYGTGCERGTR